MKLRKLNFNTIPNIEEASKITLILFHYQHCKTHRIIHIPPFYPEDVVALIQLYGYKKDGRYFIPSKDVDQLCELIQENGVDVFKINDSKSFQLN